MAIERITPGTLEWDAFYANHIFRYQFALDKLLEAGKAKVLDAACGVGFGSRYLVNNGITSLVAVDRDDAALKIAIKNFAHPAISFLKDDCHTLTNASTHGLFGGIVSLETLEHLPDPQAFIKSCYSLLGKDGLLIISTPNATVTSPDGKPLWKYHEKEYTAVELKTILEENGFVNVQLFGQSYSLIGKLRDSIRSEFNKINSNPFSRAGRWFQKIIRGYSFSAVLPEKIEDFVITSPEEFNSNVPFVLIAVANKPG